MAENLVGYVAKLRRFSWNFSWNGRTYSNFHLKTFTTHAHIQHKILLQKICLQDFGHFLHLGPVRKTIKHRITVRCNLWLYICLTDVFRNVSGIFYLVQTRKGPRTEILTKEFLTNCTFIPLYMIVYHVWMLWPFDEQA